MGKYIDKQTMVVGAGAGVGVIQTIGFTRIGGPFPLIGQYIPAPWNQWSTLGNILIGGVAFGISTFTNLIGGDIKTFLQTYGITTLIGGITWGIIYTMIPLAGARAKGLALARSVGTMQPRTPTGIPQTKVLA